MPCKALTWVEFRAQERRLDCLSWLEFRRVLFRSNIHWKDWCWSWNYNTLATWWEELTHWERLWCWERLKAREGDNRGWDGWMASLTQWTRVWVNSGSWWWTGRPSALRFMGLQRVWHDWATALNWTEAPPISFSTCWHHISDYNALLSVLLHQALS